MKYLLLAYDNENRLAAMSPDERAAYDAAILAGRKQLRENSRLYVAVRLEASLFATAVQVRNGQVDVMVGSSIKTDKLFSELYIVEAWDLNEAIRIAAQLPQACTGSIDVRPLTPFEIG